MNKTPDFAKLRVWQLAHKLTLRVYGATKAFPSKEKYSLVSQIERAAVSVESNIAESQGRYHYADSVNFLYDARGSCFEVQTQLLIAKDLHYLSEEECDLMISEYIDLVKQMNALVLYKKSRNK